MKKILIATICIIFLAVNVYAEDWKKDIIAGIMFSDGNTDTLQGQIESNFVNTSIKNKTECQLKALYGEKDSEKDAERVIVRCRHEWLWTDYVYFGGELGIEYDYSIDLERRINIMPETGMYLLKEKEVELSIGGLLGYSINKYRGKVLEDSINLGLIEKYGYMVNNHMFLSQELKYIPVIDNLDNYRVEGSVSMEAKIIDDLSLNVSLEDRYQSKTIAKEHNDLGVITGVKYRW